MTNKKLIFFSKMFNFVKIIINSFRPDILMDALYESVRVDACVEYGRDPEVKREYLLNPTISIADEQKMKTDRNYKYIENLVINENEIRQNGIPYLPPAGYDYKGLSESVKRNLLLDFYQDKEFFTMIGISQIHTVFIKRILKAMQHDFDCPSENLNIDFERYERELREYFHSTKLW